MISLERVVYFLVLAFPILIITVQPLGSVIYLFLSIIGIYVAISKRVSPFKISYLRLFSWIVIGHFAIMAISIALSSEPTSDFIHLSRKLQFLLAPFVALAIWQAKPDFRYFIKSIKTGSVFIGLIVIGEYLYSGEDAGRLSGMFNANTFGDIAVFLTIFSLAMIAKEDNREFIYTAIAFAFGVSAVVFSGSRGAMLLLMLLFFIYLVFSFKNIPKRASRYVIIVFLGILTFYTVYNISNSQSRIDRLEGDIRMWHSKEKVSTSNGLRLEMWQKGWIVYLDSPWIGYGYRNSNHVVSKYIEDEHAKRLIAGYSHLHNTYLTHMVSAGIFGLLSVLVLFGAPLFYFLKGMKKPIIYEISMMGSLLILGYMFMGLFHSSINEQYKNSFLLFFLSILLPKVIKEGCNAKSK